MARSSVTALFGALAIGCGQSGDVDGEPHPSGEPPAAAAPDPAHGEGHSTAGAAGSGGSTEGDSAPEAGQAGGGGAAGRPGWQQVTLETAPRVVQIGEEANFCQSFANPLGKAFAVVESESTMSAGLHHMQVFYEPAAANGEPGDCPDPTDLRILHSAQAQHRTITYPEGVGRYVEALDGFRVSAHYVNTTTQPISAVIRLTLWLVDPAAILWSAGGLSFSNMQIDIPPLSATTVTKSCEVPFDIELINSVSHMHRRGTHFEATTDAGLSLYEVGDWEEPQAWVFDPPLVLKAGTQVTFSCDYVNTTPEPIAYGNGGKEEMCVFVGTYYPAPQGQHVGCN